MDDREQMRMYRRYYLHLRSGVWRALEQMEKSGCACRNLRTVRGLLLAALEPPDPPEQLYPAFRKPPVDNR